MKKVFLGFVVIILVAINAYSQTSSRDSQWDFFSNVIPRQRDITLAGSGWTMTIDDKYKVTFSGRYNDGRPSTDTGNAITPGTGRMTSTYRITRTSESTFNGVGFIMWENEKMVINLPISASGYYNQESVYQHPGGREERSSKNANGNTTMNVTFDIQPEYQNGLFSGKLRLTERLLTLSMTGDLNVSHTLKVGGSSWITARIVPKNESELNASARDEFGEWNWNADRSKLILKAQSSNNNFIIWNTDDGILWSMEMEAGTKGASESTIETGDRLVNLSMSFDGASAQVFSFIENQEAKTQNIVQLDYTVFNRFRGTLDHNADGILNQIKDRRMLVLTYTVNNIQKTDMFLLEGLDTIMDYLIE